jgi:phage baseplate assembly protein V
MSPLNNIQRFFMEAIRPIQNRIQMIIGRAVLEAVKDDKGVQLIKLSLFAGEERDEVERFQNYGFTSNPLPGSECIVAFPGGNRDHGIVVGIGDRQFRLKNLESGEVALYTDEGDKIHFKRGNKIEIHGDSIELGKDTLERIVNGETFRALYNGHSHLGNLGIPTGSPVVAMPLTALSSVVKAKA